MAPSGRPNGFPRYAWAKLGSREQQAAARQRWIAANPRTEAAAKQIVAEITGLSLEGPKPPARPTLSRASRVVVNCDGLCEPVNPGGIATYGFVARRGPELLAEEGGVVARGPAATNNLAEYTAVIKALEWAQDNVPSGEPVVVRTDSQLVVNQVNGEWAVKSPKIWPLHKRAQLALAQLRRHHNVRVEWVPRESNEEADRLTRKAYAEADAVGAALRAERAHVLLGGVTPAEVPGRYYVRSASGRGVYVVDLARRTCTCPDFAHRQTDCKHLIAATEATTSSHA
ncbi:MAG: ribonuclease HI [Acidimicrobiales bacterium]